VPNVSVRKIFSARIRQLQKFCAEERHRSKINFIHKSVEAGFFPVAHTKPGNSTKNVQ